MENNKDIVEFNRSKIYEKLEEAPQPASYNSKIPWTVQQQIAATNGVHYVDRIGKLNEYPIFELPVPRYKSNGLMLDIGCGWGRWLIAGARKGLIPIGLDIRLEFCKTALSVLSDLNLKGYAVVGDLENIPFINNIFDLVWSFSVIQHTHPDRLKNCLMHINRILQKDGYTYLEFPNKNGLRNRLGPVKENEKTKDDYNSWCVRYYSPEEYKHIIEMHLSDFSYTNHSFLGIGVLKEDLKYVSFKNKILCLLSLTGSALTKLIPPLKNYSDSLYIEAKKKNKEEGTVDEIEAVKNFYRLHAQNPSDNLNILPLLKCPKYGGRLELNTERTKVIAKEAGIYYPVENNIPILISSEAVKLS
jgi:ubiquinone/menaquinone biosynthesis C-methylase UbiE/uncharacterized protein YbaR (Trm112 family)